MYIPNSLLTNHIVLVGCSSKTHVLKSTDILYFEAYDNYCFVHLTDNEKILVTKSLADYQKELTDKIYYRCHRSFLVNLIHVKEICTDKGKISLVLKNGDKVEIARRRVKEFKSYFKAYTQNPPHFQLFNDSFTTP